MTAPLPAQPRTILEHAAEAATVAVTLLAGLVTTIWVLILAVCVLAGGLAIGTFVAVPLVLQAADTVAWLIPTPVFFLALLGVPVAALIVHMVTKKDER